MNPVLATQSIIIYRSQSEQNMDEFVQYFWVWVYNNWYIALAVIVITIITYLVWPKNNGKRY